MNPISPYLRLMRLHQPVGIWLLMWPCWWAATLASLELPAPALLSLFALGAVLMRSAGCIINDIADRKLDAQVERTKTRPLASGELSVRQAIMLLVFLLALSLLVATTLGKNVVLWSAIALIPVALYPFMKRITWWPQLFLGLTFNWGALVGWVAVRGTPEWPAIMLYAGCVFWTLGYDTIYAHQDKLDDARAGIKSTALRFGAHTKKMVTACYTLAIIGWTLAISQSDIHVVTYALLCAIYAQLLWQVRFVDLNNPASCRRMFVSNSWLGALVWACFLSYQILLNQ